jgi:phosphate transport system permease protein
MSEGYARENQLVSEEANYFDRAMDTTIALSVVSFLFGLLVLGRVVGLETGGAALMDFLLRVLVLGVGGVGFVGLLSYLNVVTVTSRRLRGIGLGLLVSLVGVTVLGVGLGLELGTLLGLVLIVEGLAVGAAGAVSRMGMVDTEASASAGLLAGGAFAAVGFLFGMGFGGALPGSLPGPLVGVGLAAVLAAVTILPSEDVGTTAPVTLLVAVLGGIIVTGVVGAGWEVRPSPPVSGGLTGEVVVPLFVVLGSIVSGWAAAKGRARYGARGRQYGSFLVIYLNAMMTVVVMVYIVFFVVTKGLGYAFHNFVVGAPSALVLLAPLVVVALNWARTPPGTEAWNGAARQLVRVLPVAALGAVVAFLGSILLSGSAYVYEYTYTVKGQGQQLTTEPTSFTITPNLTVGTLLLLFPAVLLFVYFFRKYGSLSGVGEQFDSQARIQEGVGLVVGAMVLLTVVLFAFGTAPFGLPLGSTVGFGVVALAALVAAGLSVATVGSLLTGAGGLAARAQERAQTVKIGLLGGLGVLAAAVLLQPTAGVVPSVGGMNAVPMAALLGAVTGLAVAGVTAYARRGVSTADPESRLRRRILAEETRLGLAAAAGFVAIVALHVAATGRSFTVLGLTVGYVGSLNWPMTMSAYVPLGLDPGGIMPAVVGTTWLVIGASVFAIPLGVGAAVFLTEYAEQGKFTALVEVATNALWSTPSVVFGLFGATFLIPRLGGDESLMTGQLVLGFMLLPLVLITSREAILAVPDQYRDASAAMGVNKWETIRSVVLPAALPGVITGVILGVGRIAGETAPLILVLGSTLNSTEAIDVLGGFRFVAEPPFIANDALLQASAALPTQVWGVIAAGVSGSPSMGWASAFTLLMVVLSFYTVGILARTYFRRKLDYE